MAGAGMQHRQLSTHVQTGADIIGRGGQPGGNRRNDAARVGIERGSMRKCRNVAVCREIRTAGSSCREGDDAEYYADLERRRGSLACEGRGRRREGNRQGHQMIAGSPADIAKMACGGAEEE